MIVVLFFDGVVNFGMQVVEVVGNKVGQVAILCMIPALLDGIQLRGIWRQPLELEPIGMTFIEVGRRRTMHNPAIPHQNHPSSAMFMQFLQKPNRMFGVDIFRCDLEI